MDERTQDEMLKLLCQMSATIATAYIQKDYTLHETVTGSVQTAVQIFGLVGTAVSELAEEEEGEEK